jgi:hypothetical protein
MNYNIDFINLHYLFFIDFDSKNFHFTNYFHLKINNYN